MRLNENIKICGEKVILIPYEAKHVEKYHKWMMDEELRELTASEPLSIEEEYEMQKSWQNDEDKCTFLILDREKYASTQDELESLIGDTNLFLQINNDRLTDDKQPIRTAEAEIMIADKNAHGQHFGWEAILLMLKYGQLYLNCRVFIVKIGMANVKSIRMFEKIGFREVSRSDVFQEISLERVVDNEWIDWLDQNVQYELCKYI